MKSRSYKKNKSKTKSNKKKFGGEVEGFPDLFIFKDSEYQFIEVKSPTDHLSAIQYFWHDFLRKAGIETQLCRVVWTD